MSKDVKVKSKCIMKKLRTPSEDSGYSESGRRQLRRRHDTHNKESNSSDQTPDEEEGACAYPVNRRNRRHFQKGKPLKLADIRSCSTFSAGRSSLTANSCLAQLERECEIVSLSKKQC